MGKRKSTFGQVAAVLVALFVPSTCNLSKGSGGGNGGTPSDGISGLVKTPSGTGIADVSVSTGSRSTLTDSIWKLHHLRPRQRHLHGQRLISELHVHSLELIRDRQQRERVRRRLHGGDD